MVYVIQTALELGFMYALVAMALFLSYRILDIADLTTDSGFVLGAAVSVTVAAAGHPFLAILAAGITILAGLFLVWFLGTRIGLSIRATGDNADMVRASSVNPVFTITVGLCISNALTALSGAVVGQYQKSADINGGTGIVVIGLACLIIGETLIGRRSMARNVLAALIGSIVYRFIYAIILKTGIVPIECLKLVTAIVVALAIAGPELKKWAAFQKRKMSATARRGGK